MSSYTIVEKYQQGKNPTIAVRPFFSPGKENMGLEQYGLSLHDGVFHEENLACLEMNGVKRYVTGLNEFAPEVKMLSKEKKKAKITEIRNAVAQLEAELQSTKEHLKRYTSPANSKELYEKNKEVHKQRVKEYQKRTNYKSTYQPTPEQKKEYARRAYLKKKEKLAQEKKENI